jgi:heat shock protein HslJ
MRIGPLALSAVLAGCAAASPPAAVRLEKAAAMPVTSLANTRWTGVVDGTPDPRTLPRLEFMQDRVAGFTGCNMLSGAWRMEGGTIRVGPLVTTKRACAGPENEIERRVSAALAGTVTREGDRLVFTGAGGERFEFMPAAAS